MILPTIPDLKLFTISVNKVHPLSLKRGPQDPFFCFQSFLYLYHPMKIPDYIQKSLSAIARQFKYRPVLSTVVVLAIPLTWSLFFSDSGIFRRVDLELENRQLRQSIADEIRKQDSLKIVIRKLKSDKKYLEEVARARYGMVKPGETLYKIQVEEKED